MDWDCRCIRQSHSFLPLYSVLFSQHFTLVSCPNCEEDKGAGKLFIMRKHLEKHLKTKCPKRAYVYPYCRNKGNFTSIKQDHDIICEKKIVACSNKVNGCALSVARQKIGEHVSIDCEYSEVACV